ncbi:homeodomain-interacting protein kinase 3-like [Clinocottus analis]|uniref:homeodomain-interacting protein kinase 3-like n=1 Tax=Clinocottus analis TaxID=304258 RepID=UPI0035BF39F9
MTSSALLPFQVRKENVFCNKSTKYLALDYIGEGCFGKVAKCVNLQTSETTAIKIHMDLPDHIEERRAPLTLNEIRPIARQLLVAFKALKGVGIIHTDLKPDNVMLVNQEDEPFKVKLIDFGLARPASEVKRGTIMQPLAYRAPEVNLGLPICEAIDMWGLGCTLAFLFYGEEWCFDTVGSLEEAIKSHSRQRDFIEREDMMAFSHLLGSLLCPDSEMRLTPAQALRHDFITMCHLTEHMETSAYAEEAYELMIVSPPYDSYEDNDALRDLLIDLQSTTLITNREDTEPIGYVSCAPPTSHRPFLVRKKGIGAERLTAARALRQNVVKFPPKDPGLRLLWARCPSADGRLPLEVYPFPPGGPGYK